MPSPLFAFYKPYANPLRIKYDHCFSEWIHPQHHRCACSVHSCSYFPETSGASCQAWNHIVLIGMVLINGGDIFAVKPGTLLCMLSAFSYSINIVLKQLFYQTGRSTCTRSLPAGLYLSLFHNRSAGVRIPDISEHRVGLDLRSWTCSPVLSLRIRCTNCCAAIYNTGEYRIPVLPGTDLLQRFFPSSSCMRSSRRWDISEPFSFLQECLPLSMPKVR